MALKQFTVYDIFVTALSLFSIVADVATDIALIVVFFVEGHTIWGSLTLIFVAMATLLMQIFSFRWHAVDGVVTLKIFFVHAIFLAPLHRYWEVLKLGMKARKTRKMEDLNAVFRANNDICLLRLFESFVESAPQLVLQLYIILCYRHFNWLIGLSTIFSLTSIAWSMTAYSDGLRLAYKESYQRKWISMTVHTIWQMAMIASRVLAIVVFATLYKAWIFLVMGIHWLVMTCWITFQNADFGDNPCEKRLFNSVSGFIYIFCFLNLKDGRSRWRLVVYHMLMLAENTVLVILWFVYKEDNTLWLDIFTLSTVYGGFVIGGLFMVAYYGCCHPTEKNKKQENDNTAVWFRRLQNLQPKPKEPIFDGSDSSFRVAEWLHASLNLSNNMSHQSTSIRQDPGIPTPRKDLFSSSKWSSNLVKGCTSKQQPSCRSSDENLTLASDTRHLIYSIPTSSFNYKQQIRAEINIGYRKDNSSSDFDPENTMTSRTSLIGHNSNLSLLHSNHDSFNSSSEFKTKNKSSPLDPMKLWEESQERVKESLTQSFSIVTEFDISKGNGTSFISWNNNQNDEATQCFMPLYPENSTKQRNKEQDSFSVSAQSRNLSGNQSGLTSDHSTSYSTYDTETFQRYANKDEKHRTNANENLSHNNSYLRKSVKDINSSSFELPRKTPKNHDYAQDPSETAGLTQVSGLSSFFGDISSFHVSESDSRHKFQLSDETDCSDAQTDRSVPSVLDKELSTFQDDETLSALVYKQEIRKSLQSRRSPATYSTLPHVRDSRKPLFDYSSSGHESTYHTSDENNGSISNISSGRKVSDKSTDDSGYSISRHSSNICNEAMDSSFPQSSLSVSDRSLVPCYQRSKGLSYLAYINREHEKRRHGRVNHHTSDDSSLSLTTNKLKYNTSLTSGTDTTTTDDSRRTEEENKSSSVKSSLPGLSYLMSDSEPSYTSETSVSLLSKPAIADTPWKYDYTRVSDVQERVSSRTSYKELSNASTVHLDEVKCQDTKTDISPVHVQYMDESPYRLGRNVDLFNSSALQTEDTKKTVSSKPPSGYNKFSKLEKLKVEEFTESPYKSRYRDIGHVEGQTRHVGSVEKIAMEDYAESPYKFRARSVDKKEQPKQERRSINSTDNPEKRRQNKRKSSSFEKDKENYVQTPVNRQIDYSDTDPHSQKKIRTHSLANVSNKIRQSHQQPVETFDCVCHYNQFQCPLHMESDTTDQQSSRSRIDSSDQDDSDIIIDYTQYGTPKCTGGYSHEMDNRSNQKSRQVLGSLENTPGFSPIMNPSSMSKSKVFNGSGQLIKPIVSTPRIHTQSRNSNDSEDFEPLTFMENSLTFKV